SVVVCGRPVRPVIPTGRLRLNPATARDWGGGPPPARGGWWRWSCGSPFYPRVHVRQAHVPGGPLVAEVGRGDVAGLHQPPQALVVQAGQQRGDLEREQLVSHAAVPSARATISEAGTSSAAAI